MIDKLNVLSKTILSHEDGWQYEIICYADQTEIIYSELDSDGNNQIVKEKYLFPEGYDLQIFETALKLRKEYNETKE